MFTVHVDDMAHYMDPDERYRLGTYATAAEALAACRALVEKDLAAMFKPGMSAEDLVETWFAWGNDPWAEGLEFSAADHVRARAREICG
jgi:hypothetical protein